MKEWPAWWSWELELSPHLFKRMLDRQLTETDVRLMPEEATGFHRDDVPNRWLMETRHGGRPWEIIVEPIPDEKVLVVITAYRLH